MSGYKTPRPPAGIRQALAATSIGYIIVQLDVSVANVALPDIARTLSASVSDLQWVADAYALLFAALIIAAGACADRFGSRRVYAAGLCLFGLASLACGAATDITALIIFRALQGAGGAMVFPASLALLSHACRDDADARARAVGWWSTSGAFAIAAGPVLGGVLVTCAGWRSVFLVNIPLCALGLYLVLTRTSEVRAEKRRPVDIPGILLSACTLWALTSALIEAGRLGWLHPTVLWLLAGVALSGAVLYVSQRRTPFPALPPALFRVPGFSAAGVVSGTISLTFFGLVFFLSLFLQDALSYPPLQAGLAFIPLTGAVVFGKMAGNAAAVRFGQRPTVVAGLLLTATGYSLLIPASRMLPPGAMAVTGLLCISLGNGFASSVIVAAGLKNVPSALTGAASAVLTTFRQSGGVTGVALAGSLLAGGTGYAESARLIAGGSILFILSAAVTAGLFLRKV